METDQESADRYEKERKESSRRAELERRASSERADQLRKDERAEADVRRQESRDRAAHQKTAMNRPDVPIPTEGFVTTHFVVAADIGRTASFYADVLGGEIVFAADGRPAIVKLANTWVIINTGGGPTPDKPTVVLAPPADPDRASAFMNIRVADIAASYAEWKERGAEFLTEPLDNRGVELRCYMRDPDGRIIEVGQATGMAEMLGIDVPSGN